MKRITSPARAVVRSISPSDAAAGTLETRVTGIGAHERSTPDARMVHAMIDSNFRGPLMSFFVRHTRSRTEAEDLTQEVFVRIIGATDRGSIEDTRAFVFTVAVNLLRDRRRSNARRAAALAISIDSDGLPLETGLVEDRHPERVVLGEQLLADTLLALQRLDSRTRDIFMLSRLERMKQKDIASLYGIGLSTVEKHVMKAASLLSVAFHSSGRARAL